MQSIFLLLAAFAATIFAAPAHLPSTLHEKRTSLPRNLRRTARVDGEAILPLRIALTQSNLYHAYDYVLDTSHPNSQHYGRHRTAEQVHKLFAPHETSIHAVTDWLQSAGIPAEDISSRRGWLAVDIPTSQAEQLFNTEYYEHENANGMTRIGCDSYHVPNHLTEHIDYIKPGVTLSPPVERKLRKRGLSEETALSALTEVYASEIQNLTASYLELIANMTTGNKEQLLEQAGTLFNDTQTCGAFITPVCIRALYNIPENNYSDSVNTLGLYESDYQLWDQQDLDSFFATVLPNAANGIHPLVTSINNATSEGPTGLAGGEAMLDLDIAYSLIHPQSVRIFQSQGTAELNKTYYSDYAGYEALFDAIDGSYCDPSKGSAGADCGTANLTRVFSSSYGVPEIELPEKASHRLCNEIMKLTLQGHTFLASSGDYGVASHPQENTTGCISPEDPRSTTQNGTVFNPQSLDSCPYVLSCGATQVNANETVKDPESAAVYASEDNALHQGSTGGGFSNYFAQPSYQSAAVATYFSNYDPEYPTYNYSGYSSIGANGGKYNRAGRGFPDVSANGNNFLIFVANQVGYTGGTSMSTPLWGSVLTLVNQERTKCGKGPVGFVNPVLYAHPEIFNDITRGSNPGCGTAGFAAVPGWDPLTGLGTPDYPKLLEVFLNLP